MAELVSAVADVLEQVIVVKLTHQRKRKWVRKWIQRRTALGASETLIRELRLEDPKSFCNFLRIDDGMFSELLEKVGPSIQRENTTMRSAIPAALKLQVVLRYLASGDSITSLQYLYRLPKNTISCFLVEVLDALYSALKDFMQVPKKKSCWEKIVTGCNNKWNFPCCIGAIDGKHVTIKCPKNSGSRYYNYKNQFSVVLLALVDDNYNFTCIDVGSYGSSSDGGIFAKSALQTAIEGNLLDLPVNSVMLGDETFPLKDYLMKPFPRRQNQSLKEQVYNYRHCRARRISENAFGILITRFRLLSRSIDLEPVKVVKIVKACCALHNWIRKTAKFNHGLTNDFEDTERIEIIMGSWRQDPASQGLTNLKATRDKNFSSAARQKRTELADYFMGEGEVQWQYRMVNLHV